MRRRLDNVALRWQARLDSEWVDRGLPWAVAGVLFVLLATLALARARSLDGTLDLSLYNQAAWLIREGQAPVVTLGGASTHLLAQQAAFLFYPMLAVTYVLPILPALLVLQSAALALGVVPLWRVSRRLVNLRVGAAATLLIVYAFYPVLHNLNLEGFHPEVVAIPGLLAAFYFAFSAPSTSLSDVRRWWLFGACCVVVVASRADLGLAVAGLGVLMAVEGNRRAGLITLGAALGWTTLAALVIQPAFGDGAFPHLNAFAAFGDTPGSVAWGMLTDPLETLSRLVDQVNFQLFVTLFAPLLFLPLIAPRYLAPVLPLQALYLISDVPVEARFGPQTVAITAFVFIAAAFALGRIGRMGVEQITVDRRVLGALVLAGASFFVVDAASSPYRAPWNWGGQSQVDQARIQVADTIDPDAVVRATSSMVQLLAERPEIYVIAGPGDLPSSLSAVDADVVILDGADTRGWSYVDLLVARRGLEQAGFAATLEVGGVVVFERGAASGQVGGPQSDP